MSEHTHIALPSEVRLMNAATVCAELRSALEKSAAIDIDAGSVAAIDTAGVQLLVSFFATARARGASVSFSAKSDELARIAAVLGVEL